MGRDVTEALVAYADPQPNMRVLDLASGTGEPAITIAKRIAPTGHMTALDLSSDLLAIAAERARQRGLANLTTQQADAQQLPFLDEQFDLATSRFGVMFFPDTQRALTELRRVLKPGARACFAVWGSKDQPYFASTIGVVHRHVGGPFLEPKGPDPFRFSRPGSLSEALSQSGFSSVHEEARTVPWTWPGPPEEAWEQQRPSRRLSFRCSTASPQTPGRILTKKSTPPYATTKKMAPSSSAPPWSSLPEGSSPSQGVQSALGATPREPRPFLASLAAVLSDLYDLKGLGSSVPLIVLCG